MENPSLPAARPVPTDAVVASSHSGTWARGAAWVVTGVAASVIVWGVTGADILFAVGVAFIALGVLGGQLTVRRSLAHLAFAAGLVLVGALVFPPLGIGESTSFRLVQGAGGLATAALILLMVAMARRARSRRTRQVSVGAPVRSQRRCWAVDGRTGAGQLRSRGPLGPEVGPWSDQP